jgi:hypothetical protein
MVDVMEKDIVLFYYYASPPVPDSCFLGLSNDIAYRNMFLLPCPGNKIHFEFPMFEDHSYNSICNRLGVRELIKRPENHEKYIIFRTDNKNIIGFYRILRAFYQETNMFNNNGFVWGIEATPYLITKGAVKYEGPRLRQGYQASWRSTEWAELLNRLFDEIQKHSNISEVYSSETNRLVELLKDNQKIREWAENCLACAEQSNCRIHSEFAKYNREHPDANMFYVLEKMYNSNVYSRNYLCGIPRIYLK